jgi:hypothetical protein
MCVASFRITRDITETHEPGYTEVEHYTRVGVCNTERMNSRMNLSHEVVSTDTTM